MSHLDTWVAPFLIYPKSDVAITYSAQQLVDVTNAGGDSATLLDPRFSTMFNQKNHSTLCHQYFTVKKMKPFMMMMTDQKMITFRTKWIPFGTDKTYATLSTYFGKKAGQSFPIMYLRMTGELGTTDATYPPAAATTDTLTFSKTSVGFLISQKLYLRHTNANEYSDIPSDNPFATGTTYTHEYASAQATAY